MSSKLWFRVGVISALLWGVSGETPVRAQRQEPAPSQLENVGIAERLDESLPLQLRFRDERGRDVALGEFFQDRPVVLSLTYSDCPMLCHLQLDGLVRSLQDVRLTPGSDFEIVNVSIDPGETSERAMLTKRKHVEAYGRPESAAGWHFLTGSDEHIKELAKAVGFRYQFVPEREEYAHAAAIMIATPAGQLSRYLYGVNYPPQTLRLALVEAGQGKIGSTVDQILLFCFHYDATSGRYAPVAFRIMQLGGSLTLIALLLGLIPYWLKRPGNDSSRQDRRLAKRDPETTVLEEKEDLAEVAVQ